MPIIYPAARSWVNLESFVPDQYIGSIAYGVETDGHSIQFVGGAFNNPLNRTEAILWINTVPELANGVCLTFVARKLWPDLSFQSKQR